MYCGVPSEDPDQLVALILSGGQSVRMGSDKGMLSIEGGTWIQHMSKLCTSLELSVYYSLNASQTESYASVIPRDRIIIDSIDIKGPLAGLLSFYVAHPDQDVLLLPCDMIQLKAEVLRELIDMYKEVTTGHDLMVFQHQEGAIEPMPGIYTSEALKKLYWLLTSGNLTKHSLKHAIEISNSYLMQMKPVHVTSFMNANTPHDINRF